MPYELRPYQREAIAAVNESLNEPGINPVISLPTGSGKTVVISELATLAARVGWRVLILSHVKELLVQTYDHIRKMNKPVTIGLYSAGLNSRETGSQIIVAGIQSLYKNVEKIGRRDIVFIDEAHLVSEKDKSRYQTTVAALRAMKPDVRFIGLTATPFRMRTGLITTGEKALFNKIVYEKSVSALIDEGYLSPIMSRVVKKEVETQGLHIKAGEFVEKEVDELVNKEEMIASACEEIVDKAIEFDRKKVLIFTSSVKHAENVQKKIEEYSGEQCEIVVGETDSEDRESALRRFRHGSLRYVVNVNVLTTGFDNPRIDLVAIIRPTASPGLYYQMAGRGLRKAEGKEYCLLLDFGQNIKRHGPIDDLEVRESVKRKIKLIVCPKCGLIVKSTTRVCPWCKTPIPHEVSESKPRVLLTSNSSDLDPLAKRGREFFTERGLLTLRLLAKHMINLFRAGKYDNCPLNDKGKPEVEKHYWQTWNSFGLRNYWELTGEGYFKREEFDRNGEFKEELFSCYGKILDLSLKGIDFPREQLLGELLRVFVCGDRREDDLFVSILEKKGVLNAIEYGLIITSHLYDHLLLTKILESFFREEFYSREEMTEFYQRPFLNKFFKKGFFESQTKIKGRISSLSDNVGELIRDAYFEYVKDQDGQCRGEETNKNESEITKEEKIGIVRRLLHMAMYDQPGSKILRDEMKRIKLIKLVDSDFVANVFLVMRNTSWIVSVLGRQLDRWENRE